MHEKRTMKFESELVSDFDFCNLLASLYGEVPYTVPELIFSFYKITITRNYVILYNVNTPVNIQCATPQFFLTFFSERLGIFSPNFTHLLCSHLR